MPALRAFAARVACVLVVTQPDRPAGRGHKLQATPVKAAARELGIATLEPARLRDALPELAATNADLFAVASYGKIVPQAILDLPRLGALNLHPSLLPLYRGATPLQAQLRDGVTVGGVTVIMMDAGMDTGDIVAQERSPIGARETYGELHDRFALLGADLLGRSILHAGEGTLTRTPQRGLASEEETARTTTRPLTKDDLIVDWMWPAQRVFDLVRSLAPQPLARAALGNEVVKLVSVEVADASDLETRATASRRGLVVRCGEGGVIVQRLVAPNRGPMDGTAYAQRLRDVPPLLPR